MSNIATLKQNQPGAERKSLATRAKRLANSTQKIKDDVLRGSLPYWRLDELKAELLQLSDDLREFI